LAGSGSALVGVSEPRLNEQPETVIAVSAMVIGARKRDAPDLTWGAGMAIAAKYSNALGLFVARHAAKCSRQKQKRGHKARVG
jgi:hypothetical protein